MGCYDRMNRCKACVLKADGVFGRDNLSNGPHVGQLLHQTQLFEEEIIEVFETLGFPEFLVTTASTEKMIAEDHIQELVNQGVRKNNLATNEMIPYQL